MQRDRFGSAKDNIKHHIEVKIGQADAVEKPKDIDRVVGKEVWSNYEDEEATDWDSKISF